MDCPLSLSLLCALEGSVVWMARPRGGPALSIALVPAPTRSQIQLVKQYFGACPGYEQPEVINRVSVPEDPSLLGKFWTAAGALGGGMHDPFHAVLARKKMEA